MRAAVFVPLALLFSTGAAAPLADWLRPVPVVREDERTELRNFIVSLAAESHRDEVVGLLVPPDFTDSNTIQLRARYLLPDRHFVLMAGGSSGSLRAIACWRTTPPPSPRRQVPIGGGILLR